MVLQVIMMQRILVVSVIFYHVLISVGGTGTDDVTGDDNTVVSEMFYVAKKTGELAFYYFLS